MPLKSLEIYFFRTNFCHCKNIPLLIHSVKLSRCFLRSINILLSVKFILWISIFFVAKRNTHTPEAYDDFKHGISKAKEKQKQPSKLRLIRINDSHRERNRAVKSVASFQMNCKCELILNLYYTYRAFHGFVQAKFAYGLVLGPSQFSLLLQLPQKVVKIDSKIIISVH